jgi:hypothetical protein
MTKVLSAAFVDPNGAVDTADKLVQEKREHHV